MAPPLPQTAPELTIGGVTETVYRMLNDGRATLLDSKRPGPRSLQDLFSAVTLKGGKLVLSGTPGSALALGHSSLFLLIGG